MYKTVNIIIRIVLTLKKIRDIEVRWDTGMGE